MNSSEGFLACLILVCAKTQIQDDSLIVKIELSKISSSMPINQAKSSWSH
jgi:hypothetical protein